jgi:cytochrome P450
MLPHSFLLGHLWATGKVIKKNKIPGDLHGQWHIHFLQQEYPELSKAGLLYLDVWPIGYPMIAVFDRRMMSQFTQQQSQPKFWAQPHKEFKHFTAGRDSVHLEGHEWKTARALCNSGFSPRNLIRLVPALVDEGLVFRDRCRAVAISGKILRFEDLTTNLTFDMIGRAIL